MKNVNVKLKVKSSNFHLFTMLLYLTFKKISEYSENWNSLARWGSCYGSCFTHCFVSYLNLTMELTLVEKLRVSEGFSSFLFLFYFLEVVTGTHGYG